MGKLYEVAIVDMDGCTVYGIEQVVSDNALNAVEAYISMGFEITFGCKIAVRLPGSNIAIAFETGSII